MGVIRNPRAHRLRGAAPPGGSGPHVVEPRSREEVADVLRGFAAAGIVRVVVEGGDGTVREVVGAAPEAFAGRPLELAVVPAGKTNALALDLGARPGWTAAAAAASSRTQVRAPLELRRPHEAGPPQRGFVFGAGVFVEAVRLAQRAHRARLFGALAVGAALGGAGARTALGGPVGSWRTGVALHLRRGEEADLEEGRDETRFLLLASTLERLPLGMRPFGPPRPGLKVLDVAGSPARLRAALPLILSGRDRPWLAAAGYRRLDVERLHLVLHTPYVLDGEEFAGGELLLTRGAPLTFVTP